MRHRLNGVTIKVLIALLGALVVVLAAGVGGRFEFPGAALQIQAGAKLVETATPIGPSPTPLRTKPTATVAQFPHLTDQVVKIAVVQFRPSRSKAENLTRMESYLATAGSEKADLVVFPELTTTYYIWHDSAGEGVEYYHQNAELIPEGETTRLMANLAAKHGMYICWGMIEKVSDSDELYNSQVLMGPDGEVVGVYRKIHLVPGMEEMVFTPGEEIEVYDTPLGKMAIMICYDRRFPELARTYSLMGAEIILLPAATTDRFMDQYLPAARAYENSVWLVFANQVGSQPGGYQGVMHGDSRICDPSGRTWVMASGDSEEILWLEVDRGEIEKNHSLLRNRRPEVYAKVPILYTLDYEKEAILKQVISEVLQNKTFGKNIFVTPEPLPAGTIVESWGKLILTTPVEEWLVFIDDQPLANWGHPCRYVFVDRMKRTYEVLDELTPPNNLAELEMVSRFEDRTALSLFGITHPSLTLVRFLRMIY